MPREPDTYAKHLIVVYKAASWFLENGYDVSLALNSNRRYDLIVDDGQRLKKVTVRASYTKKDSDNFLVSLRTSNAKGEKDYEFRLFNHHAADALFVWCSSGEMYLIPTADFDNATSISLGDKFTEYLLPTKEPNQ